MAPPITSKAPSGGPKNVRLNVRFDTNSPAAIAQQLVITAQDKKVFKCAPRSKPGGPDLTPEFCWAIEAEFIKLVPDAIATVMPAPYTSPLLPDIPLEVVALQSKMDADVEMQQLESINGKDVCGNCGVEGIEGKSLLQCGKCRVRKYCSKECQKAHWKVHKKMCQRLKIRAECVKGTEPAKIEDNSS